MISPPSASDRYAPWTAACLLFSAVALGAAVQVRDGLVAPGAIAWLTVSLFGAFAAFIRLPESSVLLHRASRSIPWLVGVGIAIQFLQHFNYPPPEGWHGTHSTIPYYLCLALAAMAVVAMVASPRSTNVAFGVAVIAFSALGAWILIAGPKPRMDVWTAQTAGLEAAMHGSDPWSSSFPDLYGKPDLYAPGTVKDGRTYLGFPYPPVTFWMDLPGYLLTGDYRWANLTAMVLAAVLISRLQRGLIGKLAAILFLFTPRALLVLRNGWTEPTIVLLLVATVYSALHRPKWTPWLVGLLLASKQYMFIAIAPVMFLLPQQDRLRWCLKTVAAGLIASLPLILWNLPAYVRANFAAASGAAFRYDAMSYFAYWADTRGWTPPGWIGFVSLIAAIPVTMLALRRAERSPAGFAASLALVMIVFFALNKFAFCNYYYLTIAALCTVAGATAFPPVEASTLSDPAPIFPRLAA